MDCFDRVICDPWIFCHAHAVHAKSETNNSNEGYERLIKSLISYIALSVSKDGFGYASHVFVKLPVFSLPQHSVMNKMCPDVHHIFIAGYTRTSVVALVKVNETRVHFIQQIKLVLNLSFYYSLILLYLTFYRNLVLTSMTSTAIT